MMTPLSALPEPALVMLEKMLGPSPRLDSLGGMSDGLTLHASAADDRLHLVVKGRAGTAEARIYRTDARLLATYGVPTPRLHWSEQIDGDWWLILEEIPEQLPPARWLADPELLAILHRLHHCPLAPPADYRPGWSAELTETALEWFATGERADLNVRLEELRHRCQPLFESDCPISGDPNPRNWGMRADGSLVLFDWERCTLGSSAIDLAITIPGLGSLGDFERVASVYLAAGGRSATATELAALAHQIKLAKAWVLIEFLANAHIGATDADDANTEMRSIAERVASQLPGWLPAVAGV